MARNRKHSLQHLLAQRQAQGDLVGKQLEREKHTTSDLIERLGLYKELRGHDGCVNCLDWNKAGTILASGSDDQTVILWNGLRGEKLTQLSTDHEGNIFSVKFLPDTGDRFLVTGAQDSRVCHIDVEKKSAIQSASLHIGRVKRLAVSPETSGLFWSASEDGTVMQWDTREKWSAGDPNVLINLVKHVSRAEVKCIAVNPTRPELIGIGANDPYIRIYDRRRLGLTRLIENGGGRLSSWESLSRLEKNAGCGDDTPPGAVTYFVPGHLPRLELKYKSEHRSLPATYLEFSSSGQELVVNYGGEHVYYYDKFSLFSSKPLPSMMENLAVIKHCDKLAAESSTNGHCSPGPLPLPLTAAAEEIKLAANTEFQNGRYTQALRLYNTAIERQQHPILYGNRAVTFMKRNYSGDIYDAKRDCVTALKMNPGHIKALLRLSKCLFELGLHTESGICLEMFKEKYPEHIKSKDCRQLEKDLKHAAEEKANIEKLERSSKDKVETGSEDTPSSHSREEFLRSETMETEEEASRQYREGESSSQSDESGTREISDDSMEVDTEAVEGKRKRISNQEKEWRKVARDYTLRYVGACNISTDIKEASFFGSNCQFITAGSDDGKILIWDRETTNLVKTLVGDGYTVNCVQGHPNLALLASSGIDPVVRLWHPLPEDGRDEPRNVKNLNDVIATNQNSMNQDRLDYIFSAGQGRDPDIPCRTS